MKKLGLQSDNTINLCNRIRDWREEQDTSWRQRAEIAKMCDRESVLQSKSSPMPSVLLPVRGTIPNCSQEQLRWAGMTPLEWIDSLDGDSCEHPQGWTISPMSNKSPPKSDRIASTVLPPRGRIHPNPSSSSGTAIDLPSEGKLLPMTSTISRSIEAPGPIESVPSHNMPQFWDFSFLRPSPIVERIRLLVLSIEAQPTFHQVKLPYERTRDHFFYSFSFIQQNDCQPVQQMEQLFLETIQKLQALLRLSRKLHKTCQDQHQNSGPVRGVSPAMQLDRSSFSTYMSNWLRDNWINPYPDEAILAHIAGVTGTSPLYVNTWLINARTRKWRPAIVKAFEMKRPADLLMEDSINVFDGLPLRILRDEDHTAGQSCSKQPRLA